MSQAWYIVPVRGGSTGLPRKNARLLGGRPLLCHVLQTLKLVDSSEHIVVVTDDMELQSLAEDEGVRVLIEPKTDGKATLDQVCYRVVEHLFKFGANEDDLLLTIQATCPFISVATIIKARQILDDHAGSVITVVDDRHLTWTIDQSGHAIPLYTERVNRQNLPPLFRESGAVIGSTIRLIQLTGTRINTPIQMIEVSDKEGLDIDDFKDWLIAEYFLKECKIIIRADASRKVGMGHVYRALTLAGELDQYQPMLATMTIDDDTLGLDFFSQFPYQVFDVTSNEEFINVCEAEKPQYIFLDQLSTSKEYIYSLKKIGARIITFEDLGDGAFEADLVINDLYKISNLPEEKQLYGVNNVFLPSSFLSIEPQNQVNLSVNCILVLFGGSDPLKLTVRSLEALRAINFKGHVIVIQGLGQINRNINLDNYGLNGEVMQNISYIPKIMKKADLALSSAGRTITELMYLGVPTMCICQNERELTHSHASQMYGVHNIGLGTLINNSVIEANIKFLIDNPQFRLNMQKRALSAIRGHSNKKVIERIQERLQCEF